MRTILKNCATFLLLFILGAGLMGCAEDSLLGNVFLSDEPRTVIELNIQKDLTLTAELSPYFIKGRIFVENGNTLTIEPGTEIRGVRGTDAALIISQGARIEAVGTPENPIVFTSDAPVGERRSGDWGGVVVNGAAPLNTSPGVVQGEGNTGFYGGGDPNDNSGTLSYVRIEFAGARFDADTELNGLALQGVGSATTVDHIHVHQSEDDCFEFFGGNVDVKYLVCTDGHDDGFDFAEGWQGRGQFMIALMRQTGAQLNRDGNGIEGTSANSNTADFNVTPRSNPVLYNVTLVGDASSNHGVKLDRGAGLQLYNSIISDFQSDGIDIESTESCPHVSVLGVMLHEEVDITGVCSSDELNYSTQTVNVRPVADPYNTADPDFRSNGAAIDGSIVPLTPTDPFFTPTNFVGARGPNPGNDNWQWDAGWLSFPEN